MKIPDILSSRRFHTALAWTVSAGILVFLLFSIQWSEVIQDLSGAKYWYIIPATFVLWIHFQLRSVRWKYLLASGHDVPHVTLHDSIMLGNLATYVLPLRAGEFIRPVLLARESSITFLVGFVSIILERFFDLSVVLILFAVSLRFSPEIPPWAYNGAYALTVVAVALFLFLITSAFLPRQVRTFCEFCGKVFPEKLQGQLLKFLDQVLSGAQVLHSFRNLA
ncbi:MAG: flippase-like domain-containing protein, partial [Bdellovibrionales bacterium]|nr:flippase-like domain-containing protein [Bdellovibrionales bacterium]